jgi:hypothetical protein
MNVEFTLNLMSLLNHLKVKNIILRTREGYEYHLQCM